MTPVLRLRNKAMKKLICLLFVAIFALGTTAAQAQGRQPCSGKKGGISHCEGSTFVCNDGSVSASKKSCSASRSSSSSVSGFSSAGKGKSCSCRSGNYCTGPRGGKYCLTDSGNKSYLRK